jgi:hypothetical protein
MPEEPLLPLKPADQPAMAVPDASPVSVVNWQAEVNAVLPSPQAIEAYELGIEKAGERLLRLVKSQTAHRHQLEQIGGVVEIGATDVLIGGAFRARKGS